MALHFEYGKWQSIKNKNALHQMLKDIWKQRMFVETDTELTEDKIVYLKASATLTTPVIVKVEYIIPPQGQRL